MADALPNQENILSQANFQLPNVRYVKRIVVGNDSPTNMRTEAEVQEAMDTVNRYLTGVPRGFIMAIEKNFGLYNLGEHQVVMQYNVYNVGFERKPAEL
jgi:hypothetical protein